MRSNVLSCSKNFQVLLPILQIRYAVFHRSLGIYRFSTSIQTLNLTIQYKTRNCERFNVSSQACFVKNLIETVSAYPRSLRASAARRNSILNHQGNELIEQKTINCTFHVFLNCSCNWSVSYLYHQIELIQTRMEPLRNKQISTELPNLKNAIFILFFHFIYYISTFLKVINLIDCNKC